MRQAKNRYAKKEGASQPSVFKVTFWAPGPCDLVGDVKHYDNDYIDFLCQPKGSQFTVLKRVWSKDIIAFWPAPPKSGQSVLTYYDNHRQCLHSHTGPVRKDPNSNLWIVKSENVLDVYFNPAYAVLQDLAKSNGGSYSKKFEDRALRFEYDPYRKFKNVVKALDAGLPNPYQAGSRKPTTRGKPLKKVVRGSKELSEPTFLPEDGDDGDKW